MLLYPPAEKIDIMVSEIRCATGIRVRMDLYKTNNYEQVAFP